MTRLELIRAMLDRLPTDAPLREKVKLQKMMADLSDMVEAAS